MGARKKSDDIRRQKSLAVSESNGKFTERPETIASGDLGPRNCIKFRYLFFDKTILKSKNLARKKQIKIFQLAPLLALVKATEFYFIVFYSHSIHCQLLHSSRSPFFSTR
jgi:hypothetical protein